MILEHDPELELTFAEIPFSEVQSAQAERGGGEGLIHVNVAVVCSKTNLVLCTAEVDLGTNESPRIVLSRKSWEHPKQTTAQIQSRLQELFSKVSRRDRYTYFVT